MLRTAVPCRPPPIAVLGEGGEYLERAFAELERPLAQPGLAPPAAAGELADGRGRGIAAQITQLLAGGEDLLVLCADAAARHRHLAGRLGGFSLASYDALVRGAASTRGYRHVLLLDPPAGDAQRAQARAGDRKRERSWHGVPLSYALPSTYINGNTVSATRLPPATGRFATVAARPDRISRRPCVGTVPSNARPSSPGGC